MEYIVHTGCPWMVSHVQAATPERTWKESLGDGYIMNAAPQSSTECVNVCVCLVSIFALKIKSLQASGLSVKKIINSLLWRKAQKCDIEIW